MPSLDTATVPGGPRAEVAIVCAGGSNNCLRSMASVVRFELPDEKRGQAKKLGRGGRASLHAALPGTCDADGTGTMDHDIYLSTAFHRPARGGERHGENRRIASLTSSNERLVMQLSAAFL